MVLFQVKEDHIQQVSVYHFQRYIYSMIRNYIELIFKATISLFQLPTDLKEIVKSVFIDAESIQVISYNKLTVS